MKSAESRFKLISQHKAAPSSGMLKVQKPAQRRHAALHLLLIMQIKPLRLLLLLLWCESLGAARLCCALISWARCSVFGFAVLFSASTQSTAGLFSAEPGRPDSAAQQPRLIAVDSLLTSLLLSWKKDYVCSWLFSFYLYFKPHTRCRVGLELVTGARGCIIHEEEPLAAAAK